MDCYADTYLEAEELKDVVGAVLDGYRGDLGTGFVDGISNMKWYSETEGNSDAADKGNHRFIVTLNVAYSE